MYRHTYELVSGYGIGPEERAEVEARRNRAPRLTRLQVESIRPGTWIMECWDTRDGEPLPDARWSPARRVAEVHARGTDDQGRAYACYWCDFGPTSRISGSAKEGEARVRIAAPAPRTYYAAHWYDERHHGRRP